jgi:hypothetical protein
MSSHNVNEQLASAVMMIRPINFNFNEETAQSNAFQVTPNPTGANQIQNFALKEFNVFTERLNKAGIQTVIFEDSPLTYTPDSIFPNNWVTFHSDGKVVLYPMEATNRRLERKLDFIYRLRDEQGFYISEIIDLSKFEQEDKFLEGTGSMNIDRENKIVYACYSGRTHPEVLKEFCNIFGYRSIIFHAVDRNNFPVYHTNVAMAVGQNIAVLCTESIKSPEEKQMVINALEETGKLVIDITFEQMHQFSGNMLQLSNDKGEPILVMSEQGYSVLNDVQRESICSRTSILYSDIRHIETYGGGSARCMMAEIFNPKK